MPNFFACFSYLRCSDE